MVHAEVPTSDQEESIGLQLWVNLEKDKIFTDPCYQTCKGEGIPVIEKDGTQIKLISGEAYNVKSRIVSKSYILLEKRTYCYKNSDLLSGYHYEKGFFALAKYPY